MKRTISRVFFCPKCYAQNRPRDRDFFAVLGSSSGETWRYRYEAPLNRAEAPFAGFTPHFFQLKEIRKDGSYEVCVACGMNKCDTQITGGGDLPIQVLVDYSRTIYMSEKRWHSLELFTDSGYKLA